MNPISIAEVSSENNLKLAFERIFAHNRSENGKIKFKTTFAEIPIPIQTITRINMAHKNPTATPAKGTVRAILRKTQGQVSGSILSWENGKISLESDSLGAALFDQNAFERIEFDN